MTWDAEHDVVVVGSGAAGMAAALRAHDLGLDVVVLEATDRYGGSTAISGGVVWIPHNDQLPSRGIDDSREDALAYLRHLTQGTVADDRLQAYVDHAPRMLRWFEEATHLRLDALEEYADYYAEAPGGKRGGRSMEPHPFDATQLGDDFARLRPSHPQSQIMGRFGITARSAKGFLVPTLASQLQLAWLFVAYALRWFKRRHHHRDTKLHAGNALIARLRRSMLDRGIPLHLEHALTEVVCEGGRAVGVVVQRGHRTLRLGARHGVILCAGGFERNQSMRETYQRPPVSTDWNAGNARNQGDAIRIGLDLGADVALMDQAWWTPVTRLPRSDKAWVLVVEKSLPGSIFVNRHGKRFVNEAGPYLDVGLAMYDGDAVPDAWMLFDGTFRRNYPVGPVAPGYAMPDSAVKGLFKRGFLTKADTIEGLAAALDLDPDTVRQTVDRFNRMADAGKDEDFGRGEALSDRYYADPRAGSNPSLRALRTPPFYAIRIYPGDLGTKGGLLTDAGARVLRKDGTPIPGLFGAGNTTASVMGPTYPGAGGTIGPALVFGALAAESIAADRAAAAPASEAS